MNKIEMGFINYTIYNKKKKMSSLLCCRNLQSIRINYTIASKILYKKPFAHHANYNMDVGLMNLRLRKTDYFDTYEKAATYKRRILKNRDAPGYDCVCGTGNCCEMVDVQHI